MVGRFHGRKIVPGRAIGAGFSRRRCVACYVSGLNPGLASFLDRAGRRRGSGGLISRVTRVVHSFEGSKLPHPFSFSEKPEVVGPVKKKVVPG